MRLSTLLIAVSLIVGLSACANSGSTPTSFSPQSQTALLVVAGPKYNFAANTGFRRVDLGTSAFLAEYQGFGTGGFNGGQINADGPLYFSVREVVPGDYALVSLLMAPGNTFWTCMPAGGPVFTLRPGEVTVVSTLPYWVTNDMVPPPEPVSDRELLDSFAEARLAHPGLVGEARVARPKATIRWESGLGMTRNCSESPTFERLP
ncbi:MAG: hypothetical protein Q8R97_10975 [Brevundimonas sp.]|uniref:hypothetical protein n=1 Tax=Brevundimonas sp. TaxID=1871086 RepID=UPI00275EA243|nr:hypothetical protein [Brevundimonas sp.]MDP3401634.1 hypothetical protein [Brevundimonas sp.]MDZ4114105.1 hypothetical protein [Brevundimonas sp.]